MDEDTLDLARLAVCPDQVPDPEGRLIPACAYNLFYRQKDPRFWQLGGPASLPACSGQPNTPAGMPALQAMAVRAGSWLRPSFLQAERHPES